MGMRLAHIGELALIEIIKKHFDKKSSKIITGIGDDAAVLKPPSKNLLVTTDMMVEDIHFDIRLITPYQIGFKLVSVNVSDIYAMGGIPHSLFLNIGFHKNIKKSFFDDFFSGVNDAMKRYDCILAGGDLSNVPKHVFMSATVLGGAEQILLRKGARPGDKIYITGSLGDSACGLELLRNIRKPVPITCSHIPSLKSLKGLTDKTMLPLIKRHVLPDLRKPKRFVQSATSMMDISDGLLIDLSRLCKESSVGAKLFMDNIPVSPELREASKKLGVSLQKIVLTGGEDYELLFTAPPDKKMNAYHVGDIIQSGRVLIEKNGDEKPFRSEGYQHFF